MFDRYPNRNELFTSSLYRSKRQKWKPLPRRIQPSNSRPPVLPDRLHPTDLPPPPLDDSPEALHVRNRAAIAKVAALLPVNANEADLAAQCIAARAQAEEMLRLARQHENDIGLVMRLNAQYGSMVRTSLSVHGRLTRIQALRQKREKVGRRVNQDAWALHVAEESTLAVVEPQSDRWRQLSKVPPLAAPVGALAASPPRRLRGNVSESGTNFQDVAFETSLSTRPLNQRPKGSGKTDPRQAMAESHLTIRELPANGRETSRRVH